MVHSHCGVLISTLSQQRIEEIFETLVAQKRQETDLEDNHADMGHMIQDVELETHNYILEDGDILGKAMMDNIEEKKVKETKLKTHYL